MRFLTSRMVLTATAALLLCACAAHEQYGMCSGLGLCPEEKCEDGSTDCSKTTDHNTIDSTSD